MNEPRSPWWKGKRGEWYVVAQVAAFALVVVGPRALPGWPPWPLPVAKVTGVLGIVALLAGGILSTVGLFRLGNNLTPLPYPVADSCLVETGPYAIVRHPIYSGGILGALGWALWVHGWLTLIYALAVFVLFDFKSRFEERWLCERFPEYADYQKRVRKLIPWVY